MNVTTVDNVTRGKKGISHPLFFFAAFLMCTVALNSDWSSRRIVWWGCVAFYVVSWIVTCGMEFLIDKSYTVWVIAFFGICVLSVLWADSISYVISNVKTMVVHLLILLLLRSSVKNKEELHKLLTILSGSAIINSIYLIITNYETLTSNTAQDVGTRLGTDGTWNANSVGMMSAVAVIIILYNMQITKRKLTKAFCLVLIAIMIITSLLSGSRKALIIVLGGTIAYLLLVSKNKRFKTILLIVAFSWLMYYMVMEVPFFYSIIGVRVEGFMALLTGEGTADSSAESRKELIKIAAQTWKQNPIIGCGLDCSRIYALQAMGKDYYAHNNYFELLADLGVVGTALYYSGHLFLLKRLLPKLKKTDKIDKLFITLLLVILVIDYACVSYNDFLFKFILLAMFAFVSLNYNKNEENKNVIIGD